MSNDQPVERAFALACQSGDRVWVSKNIGVAIQVDHIFSAVDLTHHPKRELIERLIPRIASGGLSALMVAALNAQSSVVAEILSKGASPNLRDEIDGFPHGKTAITYAVITNDVDSVRCLLQGGADPKLADKGPRDCGAGNTALHYAVQADALESTTVLCSAMKRVDLKNDAGLTPLHLASCDGKAAFVEMLLAAGADPNLTDRELKNTSLHYAAEAGEPRAVAALLKAGARVACSSAGNETPASIAIAGDRADVLKLLVEAGAEIGKKEIRLAEKFGAFQCLRFCRVHSTHKN